MGINMRTKVRTQDPAPTLPRWYLKVTHTLLRYAQCGGSSLKITKSAVRWISGEVPHLPGEEVCSGHSCDYHTLTPVGHSVKPVNHQKQEHCVPSVITKIYLKYEGSI